ncbi:MAG: phospho-sugar mutase, partial [Bacillota bacterium]
MDYRTRVSDWIQHADETTGRELSALADKELEERFYTELEFGTAGLRGVIGAGTNRMNPYVVRRATQGLSDFLLTIPGAKERGVAIAYDSRLYSDTFALETALVLAKNGIHAYLFEGLRAVPQLSFAIRHLGCIAGVVVTASHNPPAYNGYKVYWEHGGQLAPAQADAVLAAMARVGYFAAAGMDRGEAIEKGLLTMIGREVDEAYYAATQTLLLDPALMKEHGSSLSLVYTPLHGTGSVPVRELLSRVGVKNVYIVPEQADPDPKFPTVQAPNPEDPNAFTLGAALADRVGANVILATDPDADRLGIAVRGRDGKFSVLTGNQIGCLLLEHILSSLHRQGRLPKNALVVKSIVSTR